MLTVVIPWCDRPAIGEALKMNAPLLSSFEIIVVNVGGDRDKLGQYVKESGQGAVRMVHVSRAQFNKSLALNLGIELASFDRCLMLDADIALHDYDLEQAFRYLDESFCVTLERVAPDRAAPEGSQSFLSSIHNLVEFRFADGRVGQVETSSFYKDDNSRTGPGILMARKAWLRQISGYNSALEGWGWEDIDVLLRLQLAGFERRQMGFGLHLPDEGSPPPSTSKQESEMRNRAVAYRNYAAGNFQGTLEQDAARCLGAMGAQKISGT